METKEKIDFVNRIYGLIIEANIYKTDDDLLAEVDVTNDQYFAKNIDHIRQLNTKASAELNRNRFAEAQMVLEELLHKAGKGIDEFLRGLVSEKENEKLIALFKNFESLSDTDKKAMILDNKILEIINKAKNNLDSM